jgi:hypothetical protein
VWFASRSSWPWRARNAVDRSERKMAETVSMDPSGFNQQESSQRCSDGAFVEDEGG